MAEKLKRLRLVAQRDVGRNRSAQVVGAKLTGVRAPRRL